MARPWGKVHEFVEVLDEQGALVELAEPSSEALQLRPEQDQCRGRRAGTGEGHSAVRDEKNQQAEDPPGRCRRNGPSKNALKCTLADKTPQGLDAAVIEVGEASPQEPTELICTESPWPGPCPPAGSGCMYVPGRSGFVRQQSGKEHARRASWLA